jgi:hypothetical protein
LKRIIITDEIVQNHYKKLEPKLDKLKEDLNKLNSPYSLKDILTSKPDKLYEIGEWSLKYTEKEKNKKGEEKEKNKKGEEKEKNKFYYMIKEYKNFTNKQKVEYEAYDLAKFLNVNTCPYCNINSTYTIIEEEKNKIVRPEFDHFLDKATYPILSLSIYNLIPSCHQCNSNLKGTEPFNLNEYIHPYVDDLDKEMKFNLKLLDSKFYYSIDGFDIECKNINKSVKVKKHLKIFKIEERYKYLKDIILELIQKKYMYDESYLDELTKKYEGTLFKNKEDLMRLVSGGYISEDEINKRPLSKLIKDISENLDLI